MCTYKTFFYQASFIVPFIDHRVVISHFSPIKVYRYTVQYYVPKLKESNNCFAAALLYNYAYEVKDAPSYNDYGHQESSNGKIVSGSYHVLLPDGRLQTVIYKVDDYSGYVAQVKYEGTAKYPEYKPTYPAPAYPSPAAYPAKA